MPEEGGPELLTIAQAQAEFGIGRSTIYRWIESGRLTAHGRVGGRFKTFVDRRQLRKLLEPKPRRKRR